MAALNIASNTKPTVGVSVSNAELKTMFIKESAVVQSLVKSGETFIVDSNENNSEKIEGCISTFMTDEVSVLVKVIGLIDLNLEIKRLEKRGK